MRVLVRIGSRWTSSLPKRACTETSRVPASSGSSRLDCWRRVTSVVPVAPGPGAGRPARVFSVTPALTSIEFPDRRYEVLVGHLLDVLPARGKAARLREAGTVFGSDLAHAAGLKPAKTLRTGLERMCAAVGRLGYQASVESVFADRCGRLDADLSAAPTRSHAAGGVGDRPRPVGRSDCGCTRRARRGRRVRDVRLPCGPIVVPRPDHAVEG